MTSVLCCRRAKKSEFLNTILAEERLVENPAKPDVSNKLYEDESHPYWYAREVQCFIRNSKSSMN